MDDSFIGISNISDLPAEASDSLLGTTADCLTGAFFIAVVAGFIASFFAGGLVAGFVVVFKVAFGVGATAGPVVDLAAGAGAEAEEIGRAQRAVAVVGVGFALDATGIT